MFSGASNFVKATDTAFAVIFGISVFFLIAITITIIIFLVKYNKKRNPVATNIEGSVTLEVIWTLIPTILVGIMFYYGWTGFAPLRDVPDDSIQVKAFARMWSWTFEYNNGKKSDVLVVPFKRPVKLDLISEDVVHSLYIPAFRIKEDAVPGKRNFMWFIPEELGDYDLLCAEYCGVRHSYMITKVNVISENEFNNWLKAGVDTTKSPTEVGYELVKSNGCIGCHSTDGSKMVSTSFKDLYGSKSNVITNGSKRTVIIDDEYIRKSLAEPNADLVEGLNPGIMPVYKDKISDKDLDKMIDYFKSISKNVKN